MRLLYLFLFKTLITTSTWAITQPIKIIHIGDSQSVGAFGSELNKLLHTIPHAQVSTYACGGSGPENWITGRPTGYDYFEHRYGTPPIRKDKSETPLLSNLINREENSTSSQLVIVQQGGNLIGKSDEYVLEWVKKLVSKIQESKSSCVWIGPSNRRLDADKMPKLYAVLKDALKDTNCHLVDSRKYTSYHKSMGDGRHFNYRGGKKITDQWAKKSFEEINLHLAVKAISTTPDSCQ